MNDKNKIGIIGLGLVGTAISYRLIDSGFDVDIASLCEMMSGIITNRFYTALSFKQQNDFFATHLGPWAKHFFDDLTAAEYSVFYAPVGSLGKAFMEIETEAFKF